MGMGLCLTEGKGVRMIREMEPEIRPNLTKAGWGSLNAGGMIKSRHIKHPVLPRDLKRRLQLFT